MSRRAAVLVALLCGVPLAVPASGEGGSALGPGRSSATWTATPEPGDACADATESCHVHALSVTARPGALVTVELPETGYVLEVLDERGRLVARDGRAFGSATEGASEETEDDEGPADVTFEHRARAAYAVRVSVELDGVPVFSGAGPTRVTARLGGRGLDRDPLCDAAVVVPPLPGDTGRRLPAHVRVVVPPELEEDLRAGVPLAVDAYRAIGVDLRVSYDVTPLPPGTTGAAELRGWARARYGGRRPAGVDAVYVANDVFGGGQADCLGGVLHPELGFSVGQVRYSPENALDGGTGTVSAGAVLAHEVGHTFGGHHEQGNCAEGVPAQAGAGSSLESRGPCTLMSPLALTLGRSFSSLEASAIRGVLQRRR